jgi:DNA invertase Pin-like site-specific DNA recombinase
VVWKLDRLDHNLRHLINTVHDLTKQGIGFKVLTGHDASIAVKAVKAAYSRTQVTRTAIVRFQFARKLRSSDGYTINFRNGSIAAM